MLALAQLLERIAQRKCTGDRAVWCAEVCIAWAAQCEMRVGHCSWDEVQFHPLCRVAQLQSCAAVAECNPMYPMSSGHSVRYKCFEWTSTSTFIAAKLGFNKLHNWWNLMHIQNQQCLTNKQTQIKCCWAASEGGSNPFRDLAFVGFFSSKNPKIQLMHLEKSKTQKLHPIFHCC